MFAIISQKNSQWKQEKANISPIFLDKKDQTKPALIITSLVDTTWTETTSKLTKETKKKPTIIKTYNAYMKGVDQVRVFMTCILCFRVLGLKLANFEFYKLRFFRI